MALPTLPGLGGTTPASGQQPSKFSLPTTSGRLLTSSNMGSTSQSSFQPTQKLPTLPGLTPASKAIIANGGQVISQAPPQTFVQKVSGFFNKLLPGTTPEQDPNSDVGIKVKVPFLNRQISMPATTPDSVIGGMIQWPEEIYNTLKDIKSVIQTGQTAPQSTSKYDLHVQTAFDSISNTFDEAKRAGFSDPISTVLAVTRGVSDVILTVAPAVDISARGYLKLAGYDPLLDKALYRLGLENNFTFEDWAKNTQKAFDNLRVAGDAQGASQLIQDSYRIAEALQKQGIYQATGVTKYVDNLAKKIVQPLGYADPIRFNLTGEAKTALPGYRYVPGQPEFAMGLSTKQVEKVGYAPKTAPGEAIVPKVDSTPQGTPVFRGTMGTGEIDKILAGKGDVMYQKNYGSLWTDTPKDAEKYSRGFSQATGMASRRPIGNEPFLLEGRQLADGSVVPVKATHLDTGEVIDFTKTKSRLTDPYNQATKEKVANVGTPQPKTQGVSTVKPDALSISPARDVSLPNSIPQEEKLLNDATTEVVNKDETHTVEDNNKPIEPEQELITTRKFKQTKEWQDFAKYAEDNLQLKDIHPAVLFRHTSLTAERVAEFLDGGINGEVYKKMVKPVYDSAEKVKREANKIKLEFDKFKIVEGSSSDRNASLFAQGKLSEATPNEMAAAKYVRDKYDEFLTRLNDTRAIVGTEPIPKRKDYITHLNEMSVLSELFGGLERVSIKGRITQLKSDLLDAHADWTDARAFDAAKREVEGTTGIGQYVDARQPAFRFAKERLGDYEKNPSIITSFGAYTPPALQYIYQAENVARNKAFKDVLPANSKEFMRLWNTEQVAGRVPPSFLSPQAKRILSAIKGTIGSNTILGNVATTVMQLTSFPQVFAMAGVRNTFYGISRRLVSYVSKQSSFWEVSRSKALRNLNIDMGLGDSLIDKMLVSIGKYNALRDPAARTRQAIDFGRQALMGIMEMADQFTVGATYESFYRKAVSDGLLPDSAKEYADIMTGKTQANYFKEALPPFLNTTEGKTIGQFGTYTMNQWEMIRKDLGKQFADGGKSEKNARSMFKQFLMFLMVAYLIDALSEKTFGRQPYDVKSLTDETIKGIEGKSNFSKMVGAVSNTVASYIPFMGSVKFKTMPPIFEFGGDVVSALFASGATQQTAINNLSEKWLYNILLPYGGNQVRKTLQGTEAVTKVDIPFVKNTSKKINIQGNVDSLRAILFGPSATQASNNYYNRTTTSSSGLGGLPSGGSLGGLPGLGGSSLPKLPGL